jgi:putative sterol carrier protein
MFPEEELHFRLTIDRGHCALEETTTERPDLRINCRAGIWAQIFMRQLDVREALKDRRLVLEGDKSLFTRLDRLFPPPSA